MPFLYRLPSQHTLSLKQLHQALRQVVIKHQSLRTSLVFNKEKNLLMQRIIDFNDNCNSLFAFIESTSETDEQLNDIMHDEKRNSRLFDLAKGLVFRCHVVYYKKISSNGVLSDKDVLIFNFHHALFDFPSMNIFLDDLSQAYSTGHLTTDEDTTLRYLDCKYEYFLFSSRITPIFSLYLDTVIEQQMPMTAASMFWLDVLHDCNLDRSLRLPYDRYRRSDEHRTAPGTSISFSFGQDLSHHFLAYASSNNIKLQHLALACYFTFLFKLSNGEKDLCIGTNIDNRYRDELKSMIGMFENIIPLQCQLDTHWSFYQLVDCVREIATNSFAYSYFPLQRILAQHPNSTKPAFLDTSFEFQSNENKVAIQNSQLCIMPISIEMCEVEIMSEFDFAFTIQHDININQLLCTINASLDLFNVETVMKITQRFHSMLKQLFETTVDQMKKPIYELSLILPDERLLMQSVKNTEVSFASIFCIHHQFICQVMNHPQKLAVELDEQSLTYSELLYYVQLVSLNLLRTHEVISGEIVCQCVERSLSVVSCLRKHLFILI
jgi:NRPS condensation-like uncharacterized protein